MNTLPENQNNNADVGLEKAQHGFSGNGTNRVLSSETIVALEELGGILRSIRRRMKTEGYEIVNGVVQKIAV